MLGRLPCVGWPFGCVPPKLYSRGYGAFLLVVWEQGMCSPKGVCVNDLFELLSPPSSVITRRRVCLEARPLLVPQPLPLSVA